MNSTSDIINAFELYIGDETELSSTEELALLQKKYNEVLASEEWEFLKKELTGTLSGTEISQPSDFDRLTSDQVLYIGTGNQEFIQIPFTNRRSFQNNRGFFYYDAKNEKIKTTSTVADSYSIDYLYVPPALDTTSSNPVFPTRFYDMLYHAMCVDSEIINLSDKARSYAKENFQLYTNILNDMKNWNKKISGLNNYGI